MIPTIPVYVRFQCSDDRLPEHIDGPFEYVQQHHGIMEATDLEGNFLPDFAALNKDGTWNAGPTAPTENGYTDAVIYAGNPD
jgi:hypothetical protein